MRTALIVDYAGVMTVPLHDVMRAWMVADGLDPARCGQFMRDLEHRSAFDDAGPVYGLETGAWTPRQFELEVVAEMAAAGLGTVAADGLLERMFGGLARDDAMADVVGKARAAGIRTALLSNSFGLDYPREDWDRLFDGCVISGEVGLRKPDPAIYRLACEQIDVDPSDAVFVDDLLPNVQAAEALGMAGVHHTAVPTTLPRLESLLGISLR